MITNEAVKFDPKGQRPRGNKPPLGKVYKKPTSFPMKGTRLELHIIHYGDFDPAIQDYSPCFIIDLYDLNGPLVDYVRRDFNGAVVRRKDYDTGFTYTEIIPWNRVAFVDAVVPC